MRNFLTSQTLAALRFFAAAARHLSFKRAASELNITQSAVSQQIKHLEDALGCPLFERLGRSLALTAEGERLAAVVSRSLAEIETTAREIKDARTRATIRLRAGPSFSLRWLMPRIADFYQKHPGISLFVVAEYGALDATHRGFDLAVELTPGPVAGLCTDDLMEEWLLPVCSRRYLRQQKIRSPEDLKRCTLLHDAHAFVDAEPEAEWKHWLDAVGAQAVDATQGQFFTLANMSLEAALRDQGVALGRASLVEELLERRELVAPFKTPVKSRARYCLVYRKERAAQRGMPEVMAWLREQATATRVRNQPG